LFLTRNQRSRLNSINYNHAIENPSPKLYRITRNGHPPVGISISRFFVLRQNRRPNYPFGALSLTARAED
jgi:hypothetical protein